MNYHRYFFLVTALPALVVADELVHDPLVGSLSKGWSWRTEQAGAWRIDAQGLEMRSMPGNLWAGSKDVRGWLFRPLPALREGLAAEVTVKAEPQASYEQAGMIWHTDDANYVKVMLERFEGKLVVNFVREEADQPKIVAMAPAEAGPVSLRLVVSRGKYEAQSRMAEAKEWTTIGTCDPLPQPPVQVGLGTMQGPKEKERWVRFTDFKITQPSEAGAK
ncbi:MAG TPA: DUF1349 domain-containing protein [Chthoniobacteraceae bacterium]|jgi:regulation of enolase protein 1 (concanavalin A-like superfamily)